jgi:hypothetical protein
MPDPTWRPRRRFRLSVRALMVFVLILGGWLGWVVHRARVQREVVTAIRQAGGEVWYDDVWLDQSQMIVSTTGTVSATKKRKSWPPPRLVDSIGIDYFYSVHTVELFDKHGADEIAGCVARLPGLHRLDLSFSDLSDSGLAHLRGLEIHELGLSSTEVTDAGTHHLRSITNLKELDLSLTSVGDAGMTQIANLPKLERLCVSHTKITDHGVESIVKLPALKFLDLSSTQVGDKGAARLASKAGLKRIDLDNTRVNPAAIQALEAALPDTSIWEPSNF